MLTLFVSSSVDSGVGGERRFDEDLSIRSLKTKLEVITGTPADRMRLEVFDRDDQLIARLDMDDAPLKMYPLQNFMRIHVIDTAPRARQNEFTDVSQVEKFEISEEQYSALNGSARKWMERNKLGRFSDTAKTAKLESENTYKDEASLIHIGDRFEHDKDGVKVRGAVRYIGKLEGKSGFWVGVQFDEPYGKNNGWLGCFCIFAKSRPLDGQEYFSCPEKYGAFLRPDRIIVGDFPEQDLEELLEM